jgi:hypothetical protein
MADSGKKRKRESSDNSKSPKKNAAHTGAAAPPDITVSLLPESDQWAPVIGMPPLYNLSFAQSSENCAILTYSSFNTRVLATELYFFTTIYQASKAYTGWPATKG